MRIAVYCPFLASLLLGAVAPGLARRLPPATATRLLTGSALVAAGATSFAVAVLALTLVGQLPAVAAAGHWSAGELASTNPVPRPVALVAVAAVVLVALNALRVGLARARAVLSARALGRELGSAGGQLVVVDEDIEAVAVPAAGGRILASRAQLAGLPADERRALLLHESAHLSHHHHLFRLATDLAGAVDPLQHRVRAAVVYATERWADEAAADAVGDRAVVARVLARSGLRSAERKGPGGRPRAGWTVLAMGRAGSPVVPRVRALLGPAPRQRPELLLAAAALVLFTLSTALHAQEDTESFFEQAMPGHHLAAAPVHAGHARVGVVR